jgi:ubiquinone/menaquinone biosynthesis C-methylase UbiE
MTDETTTDDRTATHGDIRDIYADQATVFDRLDVLNRLLTGRYRRRLFREAEGRVLDVACGTGTNRRYLPGEVEYVGVDLSPAMLEKAHNRFDDRGFGGEFAGMDAQTLAFPDDSFDTVVSSLSTCTFPDPTAALDEMARVCKPDGAVLLLEHGRSDVDVIARAQEWWAPRHYERHACRLTQRPTDVVRGSALSITSVSTALFGILTAIAARPA